MNDLRTAAQQALEAMCSAKLCEFNSMSSRQEQLRLMDAAITTLKTALAQQAEPVEPVGYLPAYELDRLQSGHDGRLRSAKFGASVLDGDVAVYTAPVQYTAEPVQEPVAAWENKYGMKEWEVHALRAGWMPAPPQRPPLTEEEIDKATAQERDALLDHIYEYGTAAEGVLERIRKLCRAIERKVRGEKE